MTIEYSKAHEIKRLTTPLTFKNSKAYDSDGKFIGCSETLSDVRFVVEPREGILTDDEILQYAPQSKAASKVRLSRGFGDLQDILYVNESLPWILGIYYVILICITLPVVFAKNTIGMLIILVLFIIPLIYAYSVFNVKRYANKKISSRTHKDSTTSKANAESPIVEEGGLESLRKYEKEVNNLKILFEVKEGVVRDLIEKRFEPPQITYDKFIKTIDKCHKLFYTQADGALNIIHLAAEDTPRVQDEIKSKIDSMKTLINQIENLTNELVININDDESSEEVKNLLEDMENLIDSVKEY